MLEPTPDAQPSPSVLAEKRLAKVETLALQEVEIARLRAADNAASQLAPPTVVGASEDRASRSRGAMTAIFQANVQLRRDLESSSLNSRIHAPDEWGDGDHWNE